ncbi:MAG: sulfatase, partial [Planctomycetes bacterium]|nr:sulfatase [Planctomycetota bacterium]
MRRREFLKTLGFGAAALGAARWGRAAESATGAASAGRKPNFIIILTDDQGYADVGCFGAEGFQTPHLDRMASEGIRFSDFYVGSSVCSPSRAALMTGCYPQRVGLPIVLEADSETGLSAEEETIPEILKAQGYATGMFGKWHLGDRPPFLPTRHGFDEYFGLPYSNDMWPFHPTKKNFFPDLPLIEGEKVVATNPNPGQLTTWYTERSVRFIEKHRDQPFFLYLAHNMPHVPLGVSDKFKGKSECGLYGDVCMEIDWSVGEVLAALKRLGLDEHTLVVFISDNGPWLSYGNHAGSAKPLRDGKTTTFDGGQRVPCIMRWPGRMPAGRVCRDIATAMDLLPTIAHLAGAKLPAKRIDGKDIWPLMSGRPGAKSPHAAFFYYNAWQLEAVRSGKWKLVLPHQYYAVAEPGKDGMPGKHVWAGTTLALYDLDSDIGEQADVSGDHPDVVDRLLALVAEAREDLGDGIMQVNPEKKDFFQARRLYR